MDMEELKTMALKLASKELKRPLSSSQIDVIEENLPKFLSQFVSPSRIPTHPPYPWMISEALDELDQGGGSTKESISDYIKTSYDGDLPLTHESYLSHHLEKMCIKGTITFTYNELTSEDLYSISDLQPATSLLSVSKPAKSSIAVSKPATSLVPISKPATSSRRGRPKKKSATEDEVKVNGNYKDLDIKDIPNKTEKKNTSTPLLRFLYSGKKELSMGGGGDDVERGINNHHDDEVLSQHQKDLTITELCDPVKTDRVYNGGQQLELVQWIEDQPIQIHWQQNENISSGDSVLMVTSEKNKGKAIVRGDSILMVASEKNKGKAIVRGDSVLSVASQKDKGKVIVNRDPALLILPTVGDSTSLVALQKDKGKVIVSRDPALLIPPTVGDSVSLVAPERNVIVCALPAPTPNDKKQGSGRKNNTRFRRNLVKQVQQLSISYPDSSAWLKQVQQLSISYPDSSAWLSESKQAEQYNSDKNLSSSALLSESKQAEQYISDKNVSPMGEDSEVLNNKPRVWATWVQTLVHSTFFLECYFHRNRGRKNKCNMYCLQCNNGPACDFCIIEEHAKHIWIQVGEKTNYGDVVSVDDVSKYLDITGIETHDHKGQSVVSLSRKLYGKPRPNGCLCGRYLSKSFQYCSLWCKDDFMRDVFGYPGV